MFLVCHKTFYFSDEYRSREADLLGWASPYRRFVLLGSVHPSAPDVPRLSAVSRSGNVGTLVRPMNQAHHRHRPLCSSVKLVLHLQSCRCRFRRGIGCGAVLHEREKPDQIKEA